jgi:hypothetical protein
VGGRSGRLIRGVYALCLLVGTSTHAATLIQHGVFWDYGGVGWASAAFWTSLVVADPAAAVCLFAWPRAGLAMTGVIIVLDVAHNAVAFREVLLRPAAGHLWTYAAFGLQVAFLLFVAATIRRAWREAPGRLVLNRGAGAATASPGPPPRR